MVVSEKIEKMKNFANKCTNGTKAVRSVISEGSTMREHNSMVIQKFPVIRMQLNSQWNKEDTI